MAITKSCETCIYCMSGASLKLRSAGMFCTARPISYGGKVLISDDITVYSCHMFEHKSDISDKRMLNEKV